jgi:hypothetical protein
MNDSGKIVGLRKEPSGGFATGSILNLNTRPERLGLFQSLTINNENHVAGQHIFQGFSASCPRPSYIKYYLQKALPMDLVLSLKLREKYG